MQLAWPPAAESLFYWIWNSFSEVRGRDERLARTLGAGPMCLSSFLVVGFCYCVVMC